MREVLIEGEPWSVRVRATTKGADEGWMVRGVQPDDHLFVALVDYSDAQVPVVYLLPSEDVWRAGVAEAVAYGIHKPRSKEASMRMLDDPLPKAIQGFPCTSPYQPGWLDKYREAWNHLPSTPSVLGKRAFAASEED